MKTTIVSGIAVWLVRLLCLGMKPTLEIAVAGTLLGGAGIAGFTVAGQVYMDGQSPDYLRVSAQALLVAITSGASALFRNLLAGEIAVRNRPDDVLLLLVPCVVDGALLLYFLRGCWAPASVVAWAGAPSSASPSRSPDARESVARAGYLVTESADG